MAVCPVVIEGIGSAVKSGHFGENVKLVSVSENGLLGEDHFASDVVFAQVKLEHPSGDMATVHIVVKKQQKEAIVRELMNTYAQFYNEVLVYSEIFPVLEKNNILKNIFPAFFFGTATSGVNYERDIVVVKDLRQDGYKLTAHKLFLDFNHCALALDRLGKFHALSYWAKQKNRNKFMTVVRKLKEVRYEERQRKDTNKFFGVTIDRGIRSLEKDLVDYEEIINKFKQTFKDPFEVCKCLCQPEEPVAVLCHGDFCRNNMVFRYGKDGEPDDVRFFDVATARYASPAIDLMFFLLMNTSKELRADRWDDLVDVYYEALSNAAPPECVPSLDIIKQEISSKALYGYVICSFFVPTMIQGKTPELGELETMTPEIEACIRAIGGEEATKVVTDIFRDLIKLGCFK